MQLQRIFISLLTLLFLFSVSACSSNSAGDPLSGTGGTGGEAITDGGVVFVDGATPPCDGVCVIEDGGVIIPTEDGGTRQCFFIECDNRITACGDCSDNDGDGLVDNEDPECLGPCDNTEGANLLTGVGGETGRQCGADCYFDYGNGKGGGDCRWDRSCDPLEPKVEFCPYIPGLAESEGGLPKDCPISQPLTCETDCAPLTPNGCDCFGCCTFPALKGMAPDGGDGYVFLGSVSDAAGTCTLATVDQPDLCRPCTPAASCLNTCERCEVCLGKPDIPEDCFPGSGGMGGNGGSAGSGGMGGSDGGERCPDGKQACGLPGDDPCESGGFCLTGCCIIVQ
jgi:hypothetical protein